MFLFLVVYTFVDATGYKQFQTAYFIILENLILIPFLLIFRPRKVRMFESYYLRRSFLVQDEYYEFRLGIDNSLLDFRENILGIPKDELPKSRLLQLSQEEYFYPVVIINPGNYFEFIQQENRINIGPNEIFSEMCIAVRSDD
jgi:hypothetical protein